MPLTIEHGYPGYRVHLTGDRTRYDARDLGEVLAAVEHYYQPSADHGNNRREDCPVCRAIARRQKKGRREY